MEAFIPVGLAIIAVLVILATLPGVILGLVLISDNQVGLVEKRFGSRNLPPGKLIALNGESGTQAEVLSPGVHLWKFTWQYRITKVPVISIQQGEIGLVLAADGSSIPAERILGKVVGCDDFQDARKFLLNGGEKGRQLGILTAGKYRINTKLFTVITAQNASQYDMTPDDLLVYTIEPDQVGIVTTRDGRSIEEGEIAGLYLAGHDNFQSPQKFLDAGGQRGLQEQVLLSGSWNLNPWFAYVEQVPMTEVPIGYVGIVISFIGKAHMDISGTDFKHGDLVNVGHKGVWATPLYPGKHPINTRVMKVELVPTTNIVLNWASRTEAHNYDSRLNSITVRSKDGFGFDLDVAQIIHIGALDAPKVISRVGAVQNLVDHVLQPIVGNYFRNAAQNNMVLDFLTARSERQKEAAEHIRAAVRTYDVEAIDTLIGNINPPEALMQTLTDRKIAEEQKKTYEVQQEAQTQRQQLVRETAIADVQQDIVKAERGVQIADLSAQSQIKQANGESESTKLRAAGEAEAIRIKGEAQADAYRAGAEAIGQEGYTAVQLMRIVGEQSVRIIPEIAVNGGGAGGNSVVDALLAVMLREK
ncbi:MAG TPA: SPFH domain-containing protein, partial [Phototrophicaceae bacterium]|nr:SPFH domain-containing protein [Phototrophicaceae bacterium]